MQNYLASFRVNFFVVLSVQKLTETFRNATFQKEKKKQDYFLIN